MVNGTLYFTAGSRRAAVAVDAATGEMKWMHSINEGRTRRGRAAAAVGPRPLVLERRQARSGSSTSRPATSWSRSTPRPASASRASATNGIVDLKLENDQDDGPRQRRDRPARRAGRREEHASSSAPRTWRAARRRAGRNEKGFVRGFDVRTGKRLWIFHTIPRRASSATTPGRRTRWTYTGNTGVWAQMTVDEELNTASTCRSRCRPATTTAAIGPATRCSARASSRWT